jgi:NAD(P)-dependent dehydrogenase (short-subunit alcohol dehydrogenase family)
MPPQTDYFDLTGKKAMVVGAEFPAGAAIARAYAQAGADVALCALTADEAVMRARTVKREIEAMGRRAPEYVMDVTLGKNVQVTTRQVAKEMGGLDIVASAPDLFMAKPIEKTSDTELARVMQVNFASQFFIVRTAAEEFRRDHRPGRILLVTNVLGERSMLDTAAYAAAHGAVYNLVRAAGHELAREGITVNAISLGWMDWMDDRIDRESEDGQRALRFPMLRRAGRADEVGGTAVWLAAEHASAFITGQIIPVDGGLLQHQ